MIVVSLFSIAKFGFNKGVDFVGGTSIEYKVENGLSTEDISNELSDKGYDVSSIQKTSDNNYIFKFRNVDSSQRSEIESIIEARSNQAVIETKFELVGPSIGGELIKKTIYALVISAVLILFWVAVQFKNIFYGASAILAMLHDAFILVGSFSLLGYLFGAEIDFLFVTALLTTLSFSVHDTIVVYDRIRESQRKYGGNLYDLANKAVTETMVRSLNNSFTIIFMLVALILLGGTSIKWFAVALLIGTVSGTYSSPFVAVPILVTWDELQRKIKKS